MSHIMKHHRLYTNPQSRIDRDHDRPASATNALIFASLRREESSPGSGVFLICFPTPRFHSSDNLNMNLNTINRMGTI